MASFGTYKKSGTVHKGPLSVAVVVPIHVSHVFSIRFGSCDNQPRRQRRLLQHYQRFPAEPRRLVRDTLAEP